MSQDRVYINQCSLREKTFDNGGSLINAAFKVSELQEHVDENGWVNLVIAKRREVSEKGATHYAYKSEYQRQNSPQAQQTEQMSPAPSQQEPTPNPIEDDDLPF
jgi:single-stranded DNA-binding protein|tara:strand:- start:286 stop:597 length:312 start_codon:yes stop_codon:yes gene_type:complete